MFKTSFSVDSIKKIDDHINLLKRIQNLKEDKDFREYIMKKSMETLNKVMNERLISGSTTNDDSIQLYMSSNHIEETDDGFIIYNNAKIPANVKGIQNNVENYPNGEFSVALAFEYGVGLVGIKTGNQKAWQYNVKNYNFGWYLPKDVLGESGIRYMGYEGFEIYRFTAIEIETQISKWVKDYYRRKDNG